MQNVFNNPLQDSLSNWNKNFGTEAMEQGKKDAVSIFYNYGIKPIKEIAGYSLRGKNDYVKGKILKAIEILSTHS